MEWIVQILIHTPWGVFALFAYLVWRGVRAFQPADVSLYQLAVIPALLTGWGFMTSHSATGWKSRCWRRGWPPWRLA